MTSTSQENVRFEISGKRVWIAGHLGMVGSALARRLSSEDCEILMVDRTALDLCRQDETEKWMEANRPQVVFIAATKVGGILANSAQPAGFLYDNLVIATNIIDCAWKLGVEKLMFLGSSCIYPREAPQPIREDVLLSGYLEPTKEWYASQDRRHQAMSELPQAIRLRFYLSSADQPLWSGGQLRPELPSCCPRPDREGAQRYGRQCIKLGELGTGTPRREFLYVEDLADALVYLMRNYSGLMPINVGVGKDVSIARLATMVCEVVGFTGDLMFDASKPDGTPRKLLDVSRIREMGWAPRRRSPKVLPKLMTGI
jgi:GDP-L-fucose synthase